MTSFVLPHLHLEELFRVKRGLLWAVTQAVDLVSSVSRGRWVDLLSVLEHYVETESPLFFSKLSNVWSNWLESPNCARPVLLLGFWHYYRYVNALVEHRLSIKPSEGDLTGSVQFKLVSGRLMAAALRWKL